MDFGQKFKTNWYRCSKTHIVTRQEFTENLLDTCIMILEEREQTKKVHLEKLKGNHAKESFTILKKASRYLAFTIVTCDFFAMQKQYAQSEINATMNSYLRDSTWTATYENGEDFDFKITDVVHRNFPSYYLEQLDLHLNKTGLNYLIG